MKLLAIDTCGPVIAVGLSIDGEVRERTERVTRGAEARLLPWAVSLAAEAGVSLAQLDGVAVAAGPGAFTGLRVGLAAASGIAMGAGLPVWPGSSLAARAWAYRDRDVVLSMLDARKSRVYAAQFGRKLRGPVDLAPQEVLTWVDGPFWAVGEGAVVYQDLVRDAGGTLVEEPADPGIAGLLALAVAGLERGEGQSPDQVSPTYLREADAKVPKGLRTP